MARYSATSPNASGVSSSSLSKNRMMSPVARAAALLVAALMLPFSVRNWMRIRSSGAMF